MKSFDLSAAPLRARMAALRDEIAAARELQRSAALIAAEAAEAVLDAQRNVDAGIAARARRDEARAARQGS